MNFEVPTMAEKLSAIAQIKKLWEEEAKLVEAAKAEALAKTNEGVAELEALGFKYELCELHDDLSIKLKAPRKAIDHTPKGTCPLCQYATMPPHDKRSHRSQIEKKPFTDDDLKKLNMVKVAA